MDTNLLSQFRKYESLGDGETDEIESEISHKLISNFTKSGNTLVKQGKLREAFSYFKDALRISPNDKIALNSYASALSKAGEYEKAIGLYERLLRLEPYNAKTLASYATVLGLIGRYDEAIRQYRKALNSVFEYRLNPQDRQLTLKNYAKAISDYVDELKAKDEYDKSCKLLQEFLQIEFNDYLCFKYAVFLEEQGEYQEAINQLEKINLNQLQRYHANVIRLTLSRLYYRIKKREKSSQYLQEAIDNSDDRERTILHAARSRLGVNSREKDKTVIEMLKEITPISDNYKQAEAMLFFHLNQEEYFKRNNQPNSKNKLKDTEMLNRAIYHNIANEISILKSIADRIQHNCKDEEPLLNSIIQQIEKVSEEISRRKNKQKSQTEGINYQKIPDDDYQKILKIIKDTSHDIADYATSELSTIKSKIDRALLQDNNLHFNYYDKLKKLLQHIEITQSSIKDLKNINQGIKINSDQFRIEELFEKWQANSVIDNATIKLYIYNDKSEFKGDKEKIKGILNELIKNSLKHNANRQNLKIKITSRDETDLRKLARRFDGVRGFNIPGKQKYLYIELCDNGKGISENHKKWIFLPLTTTAQNKGSGLGLFIVHKILNKMGGFIIETGTKGARFEIIIPYQNGDD